LLCPFSSFINELPIDHFDLISLVESRQSSHADHIKRSKDARQPRRHLPLFRGTKDNYPNSIQHDCTPEGSLLLREEILRDVPKKLLRRGRRFERDALDGDLSEMVGCIFKVEMPFGAVGLSRMTVASNI